jgi:hypothetical protein
VSCSYSTTENVGQLLLAVCVLGFIHYVTPLLRGPSSLIRPVARKGARLVARQALRLLITQANPGAYIFKLHFSYLTS